MSIDLYVLEKNSKILAIKKIKILITTFIYSFIFSSFILLQGIKHFKIGL